MNRKMWVIWGITVTIIVAGILFLANQSQLDTSRVVKEEVKNTSEANNIAFKDEPDNTTAVDDKNLPHKNGKEDRDTSILLYLTAVDSFLRAANFDYKYASSLLIDFKTGKITKDDYLKSVTEIRHRMESYKGDIEVNTKTIIDDLDNDTALARKVEALAIKVSAVFDCYLTGLDNLSDLNVYESDRMAYWANIRRNEAAEIAQQILAIIDVY